MFVLTKKIKQLIELYPNRETFCEKIGYSEPELSKILSEKREVPKKMIEALHIYTGWGLDEIIEVEE